MTETYNWTRFYRTLCQHGPNLLTGIDDDVRELIEIESSITDLFWSDGLEDLLAQGVANGDVRSGVLSALGRWRENVLEALETNFSIELEWQAVGIDTNSPLVDDLTTSASPN